jgi:hypothetical protein
MSLAIPLRSNADCESDSGKYIYARYSDDKQRPESCEDQIRTTRRGLPKYGVDPTDAIEIKDDAISGTKTSRTGFRRLLDLLREGKVKILAVDQQSRLTRGDNATTFIQDIVYAGGPFIATEQGLDMVWVLGYAAAGVALGVILL